MHGSELCEYIGDITYMKRPEPGAQRTLMPCSRPAEYVIEKDGWVEHALCKFHFDNKKYRKENVSQWQPRDRALGTGG